MLVRMCLPLAYFVSKCQILGALHLISDMITIFAIKIIGALHLFKGNTDYMNNKKHILSIT